MAEVFILLAHEIDKHILRKTRAENIKIMYTDEDNSTDLIGAFCELLFSRKGQRNGIIVDDYGNEWLVQLTNGREVSVYKDEVFII